MIHDGKVVTLGVILNNHQGIWSNKIDHKDECEEEWLAPKFTSMASQPFHTCGINATQGTYLKWTSHQRKVVRHVSPTTMKGATFLSLSSRQGKWMFEADLQLWQSPTHHISCIQFLSNIPIQKPLAFSSRPPNMNESIFKKWIYTIKVVRQDEYMSFTVTRVNIYNVYDIQINLNVHTRLQHHVCRITEIRSCRMGVNIQQLAAR